MEYNRIVAVTGMPGLYEVLNSKADGAIVRSLDDKSTKFVSSRIHNLSHLESIEIYTTRENVSLADVFTAMKDSSEKKPDTKNDNAVKAYFEKVYPELDFERVYPSDMKKMVKWFDVLENNNVDFTAKETEEATEEAVAEPVAAEETPQEEAPKPKKKAPAKKSAAPKAEKEEAATEEEKPKKTTRKKKTEE